MQNKITYVIKRTGSIVPFKKERVINAIYRAAVAVGGRDKEKAEELAEKVIEILNQKIFQCSHFLIINTPKNFSALPKYILQSYSHTIYISIAIY